MGFKWVKSGFYLSSFDVVSNKLAGAFVGSRLPRGPFWKTISTPLEVGKKWVFVNMPKWVSSG